MKPIVLGFAGRIASGKSTLSEEIATSLGWQHVSFGNYVRVVAQRQGLGESREVLQSVGASLIQAGLEQFCQSVLAQVHWKSGQPLIVNGIRHAETVVVLRQLVVPLEFRLVFIEIDEPTRKSRLIDRGVTNRKQRQQFDTHSTEIQVKTVLPKMADLTVDGTQTVAQLVEEIMIWMQCLG